MLTIVVFMLCQACVAAYAAWHGGKPERVVAAALVLAAIANGLLPNDPNQNFRSVEWGALWIDLGLFACLTVVAAVADRFWPIWMAAVQLLGIAIHGVRAFDEASLPYAYWLMLGKLSYLIMALLVAGTWRHHARCRRDGGALPEPR